MSRIHEALKKAEQERTSRSSTEVSRDFLEVSADPSRVPIQVAETPKPALPDLRLYAGVVPFRFEELLGKCLHPKWQLDPRVSVFHGADFGSMGAESFRTLRSRLHQIARIRQLKSVLVTSSLPAEGKTFVAANLAQSFVRQDHCRVLLIDADLRASRLHQALGAPAAPGLSDYLQGNCNEFDVIQNGTEGNLFFIPGGSSALNPSELLLGERMKLLLKQVTPAFDWVILDSPPALPVHDASALADHCDGTLFVVRAGKTDFELAGKAVSEFRSKNLLGAVLNGIEKSESYTAYHYSYPVAADTKI